MRILTVRQPWAEAIVFGGKTVENRTTNIAGDYRGPVAIHTSKYRPKPAEWRAFEAEFPDAMSQMMHTVPWSQEEFGVIIGVVDIIGVHYSSDCYHASVQEARRLFGEDRAAFHSLPVRNGAGGLIGRAGFCSEWALDTNYHLELANPRALTEPIPYKGALGLRTLDDDTVALINERLAVGKGRR